MDKKSIFVLKEIYQKSLSFIYNENEIVSLWNIVVEKVLNLSKIQQMVNQDTLVREEDEKRILAILEELKTAKPIQYIFNESYFYDLRFYVDESVLIPRPETEELVELILTDLLKENLNESKLNVLDIGTGSGCIALALKNNLPLATVSAMDVSDSALLVAKKNAELNKLDLKIIKQNILENDDWKNPPLDLVVSNPPYIPFSEKKMMADNVLNFEPHLALFTENDQALIFYKEIADFTLKHVKKGGFIYFEGNEFNTTNLVNLLKQKGLQNVIVHKDLSGKERMVKATV